VSEEKSRPQRDQSARIPAKRESVKDDHKAANELKRKRSSEEPAPYDPKLQEYLEIMQPLSKVKRTLDTRAHRVPNAVEPKPSLKSPDSGESDDEYQEVKKNPKTDKKEESRTASKLDAQSPEEEMKDGSARSGKTQAKAHPNVIDSGDGNPSGAVSDSDWLRSRTRRLLDLDSDDEAPDRAAAANSSDEKSSSTPEASTQPADEPQSKVSYGVEARPGSAEESTHTHEITGRLFVRNLPYDVSEDDLREFFSQHGRLDEVRHLSLISNHDISCDEYSR
jgi:multiple RNA-binding domain-containing protein 1